jgi:hypothetical protein
MPHDEISRHHQDNQNVLAGLRIRPVDSPKKVLVHRCNPVGPTSSDYRCDCDERITEAQANALLQNGDAERLVTQRNGKPYVRRTSIVIWQSRDQLEENAAQREASKKEAARQKAVAKIIKQFRDKLRPDENARWNDEQIVEAFETKDPAFMDLPFMCGVGAKQKLNNASSKEIVEQPFFQVLGDTARVYAAFYRAVLDYWNRVKLVADHGLSDNKGQYLTDAPKSKGELVSGGYGDEKLAQVDAHREENADGQRRCDVANFRKGSGGLEMNVDGEIVEADPVYSGGKDPIQYEEGDAEKARRLREKWLDDQYKRSPEC